MTETARIIQMETPPPFTDDLLLGGRVTLRQPARGYRAAIDPLLLAAWVRATAGQAVLELGCGHGAALAALHARVMDLRLTGLEPDAALRDLAIHNVPQAAIVAGTVQDNGLPPYAFDWVLANPPFYPADGYSASPHPTRTQAHALQGDLAEWIAGARTLLRAGGTLALILHASQLDAALAALLPAFGAVEVKPVRPRAGAEATRVLIRAVPGRKTPLRLLADLVLHGDGQGYTPEADAVLRDAMPLD